VIDDGSVSAGGFGRVPRRVWYVLVAAAWLGALIGFDTLRVHLQLDPLGDVHAYYDAGARLNAGIPLYDQPVGTNDAAFYRYPPLLAIAFRPLALLPFETAARIWEGLLIGLFVLTVIRLGPRDRWTWVVLGWLAAPIAWSLAVGQAQVAVTFLLAVGAPWAVALGANLKLLPALAAIFWIGRRDWRALGQFALAMLVLGLVQLVLEPSGTIAYLSFPGFEQVGAVRNLSPYELSPLIWLVAVIAVAAVAWRGAPGRFGWPLAVGLSVLASPRLLMYMLSTLAAGKAGPRPAPDPAPEAPSGTRG
jgi:Glycosyltransferase family 87